MYIGPRSLKLNQIMSSGNVSMLIAPQVDTLIFHVK